MITCAPGPCACAFLYVPTGNCEMWLFIEPRARLKRMWPPPAPRSLALIQRQVDRVGDEIGLQQQALLLALVGEIVRLARRSGS